MSQKTVAQLHAEIASQLPTNAANQITAADVRGVLDDMVDSSGNLSDGTPATLYSGDGTISGARTVSGFNSLTFISATDAGSSNSFSSIVETRNGLDLISQDDNGSSELQFDPTSGTFTAPAVVISGSSSTDFGLQLSLGATSKLGFYGNTPIVRPAAADQAIATDPATTMALANALRLALVNLGLIKGGA